MEIKFETDYEGLIKLVKHLNGNKNDANNTDLTGCGRPQRVFYLKKVEQDLVGIGVDNYKVYLDTVIENLSKYRVGFKEILKNLTHILDKISLE